MGGWEIVSRQVWWESGGVEGANENGEHLVDVCAERGLFLANTFFRHKMIHRYTGRRREDGEEEKSLIDYITGRETKERCAGCKSGEKSIRRVRSLCCCN